jgi:hypothetical protein
LIIVLDFFHYGPIDPVASDNIIVYDLIGFSIVPTSISHSGIFFSLIYLLGNAYIVNNIDTRIITDALFIFDIYFQTELINVKYKKSISDYSSVNIIYNISIT